MEVMECLNDTFENTLSKNLRFNSLELQQVL